MAADIEILFVNSPNGKYPDGGRPASYECIPPYGLLYCATVCVNAIGRQSVMVLDAEYEGLSIAQIVDRINRICPRFVALNATSVNLSVVLELIANISRPKSVIVGGTHAILSPADFFTEKIADKILFVCTGAGEPVFSQFLSGVPISKISGIAYMEGSKVVLTEANAKNPFVDTILLRGLVSHDPQKNGEKVESYMLTSRGCPYFCSFCAASAICKRQVAFRSVDSIERELRYLKELGVNYIRFVDDLFMANARRLVSLCECMRNLDWSRANFGFEATGRIDILSRMKNSLWKLLFDCGCRELEIGVESGSRRILRLMNKGYTKGELLSVAKSAVATGIKLKAYIMAGYFSETEDELHETLDLCMKLRGICGENIRFSATPVKAYPGTRLFKEVMKAKENNEDLFQNSKNVDLAEWFGVRDCDTACILKRRTRYNAMYALCGKPIAISEISGGASTDSVLRLLCDVALVSDGREPCFLS